MFKKNKTILNILNVLKIKTGLLYLKISPYWRDHHLKITSIQNKDVQSWTGAILHQGMRHIRWIALGIGIIIFGLVWLLMRSPASPPKRIFDSEQLVSVEAMPVYVGPLRKEMSVVGALRAHQRVVLHSETQGTVERILVQPGDYVQKGQVLIELEHQKLDAQLREVEAKVAQARSIYEKENYLLQKNAGKKISHTEALQTMRVAEAQLELVQQDLKRCKLTAPFDGYTNLHDISPGTFIMPNVDLLTIVDMQKVWVDFRIPEQHVSVLEIGGHVDIQIDQLSDATHSATIRAIDPFVDPVTHSAQVRAELSHTDNTLRPGLFARVTVPLHEIAKAIMVPEASLQREGTEEYVMRVMEDRAFKTLVVTGLRKEGMVEITDGLTQEDKVITAGHQRVRDGQKIKILNDIPSVSSPSS